MQICRQQFSETYFNTPDVRKKGGGRMIRGEIKWDVWWIFAHCSRECKSPPTSERRREISQAPPSAGCGMAALSGVINSILTYLEKLLGRMGEKVAP